MKHRVCDKFHHHPVLYAPTYILFSLKKCFNSIIIKHKIFNRQPY